MIYEFRTYTIKVGALPEVLKRFSEAYEHRKQFSEMAAFWYTEIGPLNQIIHVWPYKDLNERMRIRAESAKHPNWPPNHAEFLVTMESEIVIPAPFSRELTPGKIGPIFEMRYYIAKPAVMPKLLEGIGKALPARAELSELPFFGHTETGTLNKLIHIWPYESMDKRMEIRQEALDKGLWPPPGAAGGDPPTVLQHNKIMLAAPFSPIQ